MGLVNYADNRIYVFGEKKIYTANGEYLSPEKIEHYEFCFGKLQSVTYKGKTVLSI